MNVYIGDTPEQLGSYRTADAIIVGDKVVTKADYLALIAQVEVLKPLARRCLWGAINWNDHNFEPLHKYCRDSAKEAGVSTIDQANALLEATPTQCLREIQADSFKAGFYKAKAVYNCELGQCSSELNAYVEEYAERIREGGE